jgi:hypothetical protein
MTNSVPVQPEAQWMGRLAYEGDLLGELTAVAEEHGVTLGRVEAIGAVKSARIGYYDQGAQEYRFKRFDMPLEIVSLAGNVSIKDGKPMVHAHVALADEGGEVYGGHLAEGCIVFACEFVLTALNGPTLERTLDEPTGLPLWTL